MFDTSSFGADYVPHVSFLSVSAYAADFLVQVDGFYVGEAPPYPTAPGTISPNAT